MTFEPSPGPGPAAPQDCPSPSAADSKKFHYRAFGIAIASDFELSVLPECTPCLPDVTIRLGPEAAIDGVAGMTCEFGEDRQVLAWRAVGRFVVEGSTQIHVQPVPGVDRRLLALPLLGPVIALLLHKRGLFVLHASSTVFSGKAAVFLGSKGAGKSTTARVLLDAGHELLTDDILAARPDASRRWFVEPSFPYIRLCGDASLHVGTAAGLPPERIHPKVDKWFHRLESGIVTRKVPLARLYVLQRSDRAAVTPLSPEDALSALLKFSYVARFGSAALRGAEAARHLSDCASLVRTFGVWRLEVPDGLDRLPEMVEHVGDHISMGAAA